MIRITAKKEGFRRAGLAHSASPTDHPNGTFTKAQLAQLQAEPMLFVEVLNDSDNSGDKNPADTPAAKPAAKRKSPMEQYIASEKAAE